MAFLGLQPLTSSRQHLSNDDCIVYVTVCVFL